MPSSSQGSSPLNLALEYASVPQLIASYNARVLCVALAGLSLANSHSSAAGFRTLAHIQYMLAAPCQPACYVFLLPCYCLRLFRLPPHRIHNIQYVCWSVLRRLAPPRYLTCTGATNQHLECITTTGHMDSCTAPRAHHCSAVQWKGLFVSSSVQHPVACRTPSPLSRRKGHVLAGQEGPTAQTCLAVMCWLLRKHTSAGLATPAGPFPPTS